MPGYTSLIPEAVTIIHRWICVFQNGKFVKISNDINQTPLQVASIMHAYNFGDEENAKNYASQCEEYRIEAKYVEINA